MIIHDANITNMFNPELHIYAKGNHGFGMNRKDLPVDTWIERFADWLDMLGFQ